MKRKKTFITFGIIALVLFLGVGYAVVSSVYLNIGGTASVSDSELKVEITNAVASTTVAEKTVDFNHTLSNDKLSSNFTLNGMELNETVSITYTVTNNETDVDAVLTATDVDLTNSNSDFFDVDYEITDAETDLENDDKTMTVVVNVCLIQTPVAESEGTTTVGLTLTASPKGGSSGSGGASNDILDNSWPISWNSMEVVNNTSLSDDVAAVRVSSIAPSLSELQSSQINVFLDGENFVLKYLQGFEVENGCAAAFVNADSTFGLEVLSASVSGDFVIDEESSFTVSKSGFYVSKIDSDIEFTLEKTMTTPYFGEKYRMVSFFGIDVSEGGSWVTFYEDGRLEQSNEFSKESNSSIIEGFTYSNNVASKAGSSEFENMVISSNGVYITQYENDSIVSTYILESEYIDKFSDVPLKFAESYNCTVDNYSSSENSLVGDVLKFYPDGSAVNDEEFVPVGSFRYYKNEIFSSLIPAEHRLLISDEGRTLTMMSGENVLYVYELSTNIPISWNTKDVMNNTSVVIDNSVINDLPQENPEFVKISDEYLLLLRIINCSIYADGVSDYLHFDYYEGDNNILVKYSNGTENFYLIIIYTVGDYLGTTFTEQGIYAYNVSGYDSNVNLDLKLEYTKK